MKSVLTSSLFAGSLIIGLSACSQQSWYHGAQSAQTAHCMEQPPAEYDDCIKQSREMSYDEYEKNREELKIKKESVDY